MNRRTLLTLSTLTLTALWANAPRATERIHTVGMWTEGAHKFYDPAFIRAQVGDAVRFINISGHHNTESIRGMLPDGVSPWNSALDTTFDLTLTHEGVYGYKCTPHYEKAMVGLIVVGDASVNADSARAVVHPEAAQAAFDALFSRV
ncbi:MAG: pseudoazurin [Pseudomonadota bacterium]